MSSRTGGLIPHTPFRSSYNMHGVGFEPTKHNATALKTVPFDRSGIRAWVVLCHLGLFYNSFTIVFPLFNQDGKAPGIFFFSKKY